MFTIVYSSTHLFLTQLFCKTSEKKTHFGGNFRKLPHLGKDSTLSRKKVAPEIKDGYRIGKYEVSVWFVRNGKKR